MKLLIENNTKHTFLFLLETCYNLIDIENFEENIECTYTLPTGDKVTVITKIETTLKTLIFTDV